MSSKQYNFDEISPSSASGDYLAKVLEGVRGGACTLYKNTPGALIPNPISELIHGIWDSFCDYPSNPGLPPQPAPPFQGGQCIGASYRVVLISETANYPNLAPGTLFTTREATLNGPLSNFSYAYRSAAIGYQGWINFQTGTHKFSSDGGAPGWLRARSLTVTRLGGQPDNCGNLPPQFPPAPFPGNPDYVFPITVTYNDGANNNYTVNFKPPGGGIGINPNFNLIIEDLNLNINLDLGGVTINFPAGGGDVDLTEIVNKLDDLQLDVDIVKDKQDDLKTDFDDFRTDFDDFDTDFDDFRKDYDFNVDPPPPDPTDPDSEYDFEEEEDKNSEEKDNIDELKWVIIDLTSYPRNIKQQYGGGSAPDVLYAGWIQFKVDDRNLPRLPVHFAKNIYAAPPGANGYGYTLYIGILANVSTITKKTVAP